MHNEVTKNFKANIESVLNHKLPPLDIENLPTFVPKNIDEFVSLVTDCRNS